MTTFLIIALTSVLVICCLLLTGVVLLQRPRSEGLGSAFGGGMTESVFGAGTTDVLTRFTIWMAGAFFVCTLLLAILISHGDSSKATGVLEKTIEAKKTPIEAVTPALSVEDAVRAVEEKPATESTSEETAPEPAEKSASAPAADQ